MKTLIVRESTQEDWWTDVVAACSLEKTLTQSDSAFKLTLSSVGGIVSGVLHMWNQNQALLNTTEVTQQQRSISFG